MSGECISGPRDWFQESSDATPHVEKENKRKHKKQKKTQETKETRGTKETRER
jgi:hypothetical protein